MNTKDFLAVTDFEVINGMVCVGDKSRKAQWHLTKHKDGEVIAEINETLSRVDSIHFLKDLEEAHERRRHWHDFNIPEGWTSARAFLLYDHYFKSVFPDTCTHQQAEIAIEQMIADEMVSPKAYEHVAQSRGWGKRHEDKNHQGSDLISEKGRLREVKMGFKKSKDQSGSYLINNLGNKPGVDLVVYIVEKTFVIEYFFPAGIWETRATDNHKIYITPFPKRKGDYWYENFSKVFMLNGESPKRMNSSFFKKLLSKFALD